MKKYILMGVGVMCLALNFSVLSSWAPAGDAAKQALHLYQAN